ncbi:MAG: hypothetical protein JWM91_4908 [Rhodospirillales bacterium]|nr:hypothetical protein [Rhodospirillales bacterium]
MRYALAGDLRGNAMRNVAGTRHSLRTTRRLTILAQDPAVKRGGELVRAQVEVPAEQLLPGPCGYRINVVDYDASTNTLYQQLDLSSALVEEDDPYREVPDETLLADPRFHAQNVYAIAIRILARFEFALGRRVPWGCAGHQLHLVPHAAADPNAFYSREDRSIFFGYFRALVGEAETTVCTCLSHDVIAHETTHAILDGLRAGLLEPSLPDQAAFHEGFADVVALLSIFSLPEIVSTLLPGDDTEGLIAVDQLTPEVLRQTALFGLAKQVGEALSRVRGEPLRRSITIPQGHNYLDDPDYAEEHVRGELVVAAMLNAFLDIWVGRLARIGTMRAGFKDRSLVVEEGARAADHLLTMAIRAIDYCPPVDLSFSDYLSALLTVDREVVPDDKYGYRDALLRNFRGYGIEPRSTGADGSWSRCDREFVYSRTHFDSMLRDREEVFRFVWENRTPLELSDLGYIDIQSVRPSIRIAPDGFILRETIVEYVQRLTLTAKELASDFKVTMPTELPGWRRVSILGGGTIVFDEYGQVKYQIANHLLLSRADRLRQSQRIAHLFAGGYFDQPPDPRSRFALMHMNRTMEGDPCPPR